VYLNGVRKYGGLKKAGVVLSPPAVCRTAHVKEIKAGPSIADN
jgi:hypothetical protein